LPDPEDSRLEKTIGIGDFRVVTGDDISLNFVDNPENPMDQFFRITAPAKDGRHSGGLKHYIRATPNNTYRVRVRARTDAPGVHLGVQFKNLGVPSAEAAHLTPMVSDKKPILTEDWEVYTFEGQTFSDERLADRMTAITIGAAMAGNPESEKHVYFDWVELEDENAAHPSGFREEVVETLKEAQVGTTRFYGIASLGATVDALTAASARDASWSYVSLASRLRFGEADAVVDDWLTLSQTVDATPWLTIGGGNTPDDWYRLISYLAAPADFDADAGRRAAHGHAAPWTDQFDTLYLEVGNEWWNPIFRPYYVWSPEKYGELCNTILERVREHPHFDADRIQLVVGGWAINAHHWNGKVDATSQHHDRLSLAPYLVHELERAEPIAEGFRALFADVEGYHRHGGASTLEDLKENGKDTRLALYELNTHITGGSASKDLASALCSSVAAGVAVLDQALYSMTEMGASPINYFTFLKRQYNGRYGLWGNLIRTPDGSLRARPVWHGLRMANRYLGGAAVRLETSDIDTWDQPKNGSVPEMDDVPYVHAYAFRDEDGDGLSVFLINRDVAATRSVSLELPGAVSGSVTRTDLSAPDPAANNEDTETVTLKETTLTSFTSGDSIELAPASATVFHFPSVESQP
jgi:alpha-L-arabinofuranosidase